MQLNLTLTFFEMSHGKSVSDGLGSVVKNSCLNADISKNVLLNIVKAVFEYCNENLAHGPQEKSDNAVSKWDLFISRKLPITTQKPISTQ